MFESLSDRLSQSLKQITGKARLTDENIADALRDVRMALLEADAALPVVKDFIEQVRAKAIGQAVYDIEACSAISWAVYDVEARSSIRRAAYER